MESSRQNSENLRRILAIDESVSSEFFKESEQLNKQMTQMLPKPFNSENQFLQRRRVSACNHSTLSNSPPVD